MTNNNLTKENQVKPSDPLEIQLVYQVRSCRTCKFFWPEEKEPQPYGPFPGYDFNSDTPEGDKIPDQSGDEYPPPFPWLEATTVKPGFPNPEIMDGCRKAPIMTIGINPNLTAFAPGQQGASWCYPGFTSDDGTDEWTKYAYYYRYRTVYQECLDFSFIKKHLLKDDRIIAKDSGKMVSAERKSDSPDFDIVVQYDGESGKTKINLKHELGSPRYVLLFNTFDHNNTFKKGDIIAAKLNVPGGLPVNVNQQQIGYYEQFVPVLKDFTQFLTQKGLHDVKLEMGEDVCQLDMVACASPHWNQDFLGGKKSENIIIGNCVSDNIWAIKQFLQTNPAVLFLVGESSYDMFKNAFGNYIECDPPLPEHPEDGAFSLLRATTENDCRFKFSTEIDGKQLEINTRLIVSPHFSYNTNFLPQFRMSQKDWDNFQLEYKPCYDFLADDKRIKIVDPKGYGFWAFEIESDAKGVFDVLEKKYTDALKVLMGGYYSAHTMLADVLEDLYDKGDLTYKKADGGISGYLGRGKGGCKFCVNEHWTFPLGCPYDKTEEPAPDAKFLEEVAVKMVSDGKPH